MFIKFGSEENITQLYEQGLIYMNSKEFFRKVEDKELRGDAFEGIKSIKNSGPGKFRIDSINHTVNYINLQIKQPWGKVYGNIYSLFCISLETTPNLFEFKMDERVINFGSHCLLIPDSDGFINLVSRKAKEEGYNLDFGLVNYFEKSKFSGEISPFDKPNEFLYQKEYRFYLERIGTSPISFKIGSLKDKSKIMKTEDVLHLTIDRPKPSEIEDIDKNYLY